MKNVFCKYALLTIALFHFSGLILGQKINWETTEKVYVKTSHGQSFTKNPKVCKIDKCTYIISKSELSTLASDSIIYTSPIWRYEQGSEQYAIDNSIILYDVNDLNSLINNVGIASNVISIDSIYGTPKIYILYLRKMNYKQIDLLSETLKNSSYCKLAEPNLITFGKQEDAIIPDTNPYYTNQWGLNNNSHPSVDINAPEAWNLSTGYNTKVAVIDCGFELHHPDLESNIFSSYDCTNGMDGATNGAYLYNRDSHGTQCAGVIAAVDNNIGVIGVAPGSQLILLRRCLSIIIWDDLMFRYDTISISQDSWNINAIRTAYLSGADVISNSWSYSSLRPDTMTVLNAVLGEAYTLGRGGKGCVIICSTGNNGHNHINYPSYSPYTISVGALNAIGQRPTWSNYGQSLDLVAPGNEIWTTQIVPRGYYCMSSGTSMAAPMVAGVAALILSKNPYLTNSEVQDIILSTAYKLPDYNFNPHSSFGTWNNEVGYGLVDAYAAVLEARNRHPIQGPDYVCDTAKYYLLQPSQTGETVTWSVDNGSWIYPHYSIIGSANQDTVYVRCERMTIVPPGPHPDYMNSGNTSFNNPIQSLSVTISNGTTSNSYTKQFRSPTGNRPIISASNSAYYWRPGTTRTFTVSNCTSVPDSALHWEVKRVIIPRIGPNVTTYTYSTGRTMSYQSIAPPAQGICTLDIKATNTLKDCLPNDTTLSFMVRYGVLLNAYDDGDQLQVTISEEDSQDSQQIQDLLKMDGQFTLELWNSVHGRMLSQPARSTNEQMNIAGFPQGVYVLRLKDGGEAIAETKVIIQ